MENLSEAYKILIVLTATGLLLIPIIIIINKYEQGKQKRFIEKMALTMYNMHKNLIVTDFEIFPIEFNNYSKLDLNFYNTVSSNLILNHFNLIGDFEESSFRKTNPNVLFFTRFLISGDSKIKATIYHLKIGESSFKITEFCTEFTNGTVLITTNNFLNTKLEYPDDIKYSYKDTRSTDDLLKHHKNRIQDIQTEKCVEIQKTCNINEIQEQTKRIKLKENLFRKSMNKETIIRELKKFSIGFNNERISLKIAERIMELKVADDK